MESAVTEIGTYLSTVTDRLAHRGFVFQHKVAYRGHQFDRVATRMRWQAEFFGFVEFFYVFSEFPVIDIGGLEDFSKRAFKYAIGSKKIPLPCGLLNGVVCFPVAVAHEVGEDTRKSLEDMAPPKHCSAFEMPVIYVALEGKLVYSERTPRWGSMYYGYLRSIIRETLGSE